jgi:hypothetical protein
MAITKNQVVDKIEITATNGYYHISVREAEEFIEDGKVVAKKNHRYGLEPNSDESQITDPLVQDVFTTVMSDDVKAAHLTAIEKADE